MARGGSFGARAGLGPALGEVEQVRSEARRPGARGIAAGGEGRPARRRWRHSARLEPEEEEKGRLKKRRRPGRRG